MLYRDTSDCNLYTLHCVVVLCITLKDSVISAKHKLDISCNKICSIHYSKFYNISTEHMHSDSTNVETTENKLSSKFMNETSTQTQGILYITYTEALIVKIVVNLKDTGIQVDYLVPMKGL